MATKKRGRSGSGLGLGNILDVLSSGRDARGAADEPVRICVLVDLDAPRDLVLAVKECLVPVRPAATVDVWPLGVRVDALPKAPDAVVVLCGPAPGDVLSAVWHFSSLGVPSCMAASSALDAPDPALPDAQAALVETVAASDARVLPDKLAAWLVSAAGEKDVALAAAFPFCRREATRALARRCALENAAIGAVSLVPGSDFPLMTTNQAKLAIEMSSCYGRTLTPRRAAELAGVVGAGVAYRACARTLTGLLPGLALPLKAGMGYAGTMATARALQASFEQEDDATVSKAAAAPAAVTRPQAAPSLAPAPTAPDYLELDQN